MHTFSRTTGISVVVANMIGTGVFTSLGFQLLGIQSFFVLMMLWLIGGLTALCGALTYAELGANLPRSGGEYNFLSRLYHPAAGFISGWVSATVGFAAPVALAAMTFGAYLSAVFPDISSRWSAVTLVLILTLLHCRSRQTSSAVQQLFTALKVLLILLFCAAIFIWGQSPEDLSQGISFAPQSGDSKLLFSGAFAVALIYVNYAYTGWNAATYVTSELDNPQRNLPIVLFIGTGLVMMLYLLLNFTFLSAAPIAILEGKLEVGVIVADHALGDLAGKAMGLVLALLLISTVSAMTMAGPRVLQVIGEDFKLFSVLSRCNRHGVPMIAIVFQGLLAVGFILSATFESILVFSSFVLGINTLFAVLGVFVMRWEKLNIEGAYKTFGYPVVPLIYLSVTVWTLAYVLISRPIEGGIGVTMIAAGGLLYRLSANK
ncbi:amino acid permease [Porticoccaceae bacterium]|jgi:APA family basic amino acid/polyamine antiporter|nr:amino acid permease [Porticoccaceae bacterium]